MTQIHSFEPQARVTLRTVLVSMIVLWATYFAITTLRAYVIGFELQMDMMWRRGVVTLVGIAMTVVFWLFLRLFDSRPLGMKVAAGLLIALPISIPIAQVNQWMFEDIQRSEEASYARKNGIQMRRDDAGNLMVDIPVRGRPSDPDNPVPENEEAIAESYMIAPAPTVKEKWLGVIDIALGRYFLLLAWASLYFALLAIAQVRRAERRAAEFREAARAAELRSLRYQVNPHFLFNTLNSLSAMVLTGKAERAEQMIQTMSRFYRQSLAEDPMVDARLDDEFDLQEQYLAIEAVRFPDRLISKFDLPRDLEDARVPGMILQPLIENSVKYAVSAVNRPVTITVAAREEFDRLVITVTDDGPGVPAGASHGFGIGLANVRDRLEARFGPDVVLSSSPIPGGYKSEIRIPLTRNG
ncbi:histidine kinase [Altererythrobacter arenosus]|uniref:Histidine kinase n=1 Tax=Altererythrobacter arenosus TaxID=3032592 RepID=A0ABY8FXB5_9SPHN|nr:histidine kinase [Altererythrobacter sp. CAU 1644]WFL78633.1 histidine kinase [Altererythrobacter sp. CAU 1644]